MELQVWGKGQTNSTDYLKGKDTHKVRESDEQISLNWVDLTGLWCLVLLWPHTWAGASGTGTSEVQNWTQHS